MKFILIIYSSLQDDLYTKRFDDYDEIQNFIVERGFKVADLKQIDDLGKVWFIKQE